MPTLVKSYISAAGTTPTGYDFGYTTLANWWADTTNIRKDLTSADEVHEAHMAAEDFTTSGTLTITGATTDSTRFYTIKAAPGCQFDGTYAGRVKAPRIISADSAQTDGAITVVEDYTVIEGIVFDGDGSTQGYATGAVRLTGDAGKVANCGFFNIDKTDGAQICSAIRISSGQANEVTNNVISNIRNFFPSSASDSAVAGIFVSGGTSPHCVHNNTIGHILGEKEGASGVSYAAAVFVDDPLAHTVYNNIGFDCEATGGASQDDDVFIWDSSTHDYNAADDTSTSGEGNGIASIVPSNEIKNPVHTGFDCHLLGTSQLIDAGIDLNGTITYITDIDGGAREDSNWDIGADEYGYGATIRPLVDFVHPTCGLFADNTTESILAQGLRDFSASVFGARYIISKSEDYTAEPGDEIILMNATANNRTVNLPAVSVSEHMSVRVVKTDSSSNTVTLDGNSSEEIDGATTFVLSDQYDAVHVVCDGSEWFVISQKLADEDNSETVIPGFSQGRLTAATGTSVTSSDQTAISTIYFTPHNGDLVSLYNGSSWEWYEFSEMSTSVPSTTDTNFDVFLDYNGGSPTLQTTNWTNDTTRTTSLTTQDGAYVQTGNTDWLYLGTCRTTGSSGETEDSAEHRYIWNAFNQTKRPLRRYTSTNTWVYGSNAWRVAENNTANSVEVVVGLEGVQIFLGLDHSAHGTTSGDFALFGIGEDSTSNTASESTTTVVEFTGNSLAQFGHASMSKHVAVGQHTYYWLERAYSGSNVTNYGFVSDGGGNLRQAGLTGFITG